MQDSRSQYYIKKVHQYKAVCVSVDIYVPKIISENFLKLGLKFVMNKNYFGHLFLAVQ